MNFEFLMPTKIVFGNGSLDKLPELVRNDSILIICDPVIYRIGIVDKIKEKLNDRNIYVYADVNPNPTFENVDDATLIGRKYNVECVIGLGGGSSMDTAKAVSCLLTNGGIISDYAYSGKNFDTTRLNIVLIPTTSGTGSECTAVGVFADKEKNRKFPFFSPQFRVDAAVIDPTLTYSAPRKVTASTGIDAFTHAIESYWNITYSPVTDLMAMGACDLVLKNLSVCYEHPDNSDARSDMALASLLGGFTFGQTKTTVIHSLSFPLADYYNIDHGSSCALTLVPFIRYVYTKDPLKMDKLIHYCGFSSIDDFSETIYNMIDKMELPQNLRAVGAVESDIDSITEEAFGFGMTRLLPGKISRDEIKGILNGIMD